MKQYKKNIAVLGVGILPTGPGNPGVPSMINVLAKLCDHNLVTLYSFIWVDASQAPKGLRVRSIGKSNVPLKMKYALLFLRFIIDHVVKNFDVIHAQSPYPAGIMSIKINKFFKIPWILFLDGGETVLMPHVPYGDLLNHHLKNAAVQACAQAHHIVALTNYQARLTQFSMKLAKEILVLPRGVNVTPYQEKLIDLPLRFVHISTYHPIKDYETLLKTFSIIAQKYQSELIMVGRNEHPTIRELIKSLSIEDKVKFTGTVPNGELSEVFSVGHILLHTSIYESMGMVVAEAMANGLLVAGTRVGLIADLSEQCLPANPGDCIGLANEIFSVVEDNTKFQQLRTSAYRWVKNHDLDWYVAKLEAVYEDSINSKSFKF